MVAPTVRGALEEAPMHRHVIHVLLASSLVLASRGALAAGHGAPPSGAPAPDQSTEAPPERPRSAGFGVGVALHRFQDDFGFGLVAGSPEFARMLRVTLGGGLAFLPHVVEDGQESWVPYGHGRAVLEIGSHLRALPLRLYGFGGAQGVFVSSRLRDTPVGIGGIGGFGFEAYFDPRAAEQGQAFFVELGAVGTGLTASNVASKPSLQNGFVATVGYKLFP
jgi:hypothetical protein